MKPRVTIDVFEFPLTRESSGGHQARKRKKGRKNLSPRNTIDVFHSVYSTRTDMKCRFATTGLPKFRYYRLQQRHVFSENSYFHRAYNLHKKSGQYFAPSQVQM
jgi:hypothetical protein